MKGKYIVRRRKVEKDEARKTAQNHANANSKILGDIVGIKYAKSGNNSAKGLDQNGHDNNPIVTGKEAIFGHGLAIQEDDANEEGREQRIHRQLDIAHPDRCAFG